MAEVIHYIYAVPTDGSYSATYEDNTRVCAEYVRAFYAEQKKDGKSLTYSDPIVEVVNLDQNINYVQNNAQGTDLTRYYLNLKAAVEAVYGTMNDHYVLLCPDAATNANAYNGYTYTIGGSFVAVGDFATINVRSSVNRLRWAQVAVHEIGHMMGLTHTTDGSIMDSTFSSALYSENFNASHVTTIRSHALAQSTVGPVFRYASSFTGLSTLTA